MFLELLVAVACGIVLGSITGIIPGIHVNLLSTFIISFSPLLLPLFSPLVICGFILSIAITHTFLDVIPTTFLGVPEANSPYVFFPSQQFVLEGRGYQVIFLSTFGALGSLLLSLLCVPLFLYFTQLLYPPIQPSIGWILLLLCIFLFVHEKEKLWALFLFFLSGTLGLAIFSLPLEQVLFPLFSGMFGVSTLALSLKTSRSVPKQKSDIPELKESFLAIPLATFTGWITSFMPGLGPAQAATISSSFVKMSDRGYMVLFGGLSTVNTLLALLSYYLFQKTRSGILVSIAHLIVLDRYSLFILFGIALSSAGIASFLTILSSKYFAEWMTRMDYFWLNMGLILFIFFMTLLLTGSLGVCILIVSTAVGVLPEITGVAKSHMMGCLLLPAIIFFLL